MMASLCVHRAMSQYPAMGSNTIVDVSVKIFLNEINIKSVGLKES